MRLPQLLYRFIVTDRPVYVMYVWDVEKHGSGKKDDDVVEWDPTRPLDPLVDKGFGIKGPALPRWRMRHLWRKGLARLFTLMVDGKPACFGMTQDWSLHRRELASFGREGDMLGPHWTLPEYRRRGLYSRTLMHTVYALAERGSTYMYAWILPNNIGPRKTVERFGFHPLGCWEFRRSFCRLHVRVKLLENRPATLA